MSNYLDPIDKEYIEALFPRYLLEQPIGYKLWKNYYSARNKFRDMHKHASLESESSPKKDNLLRNNIFARSNFKDIGVSSHGLSLALRKEIWANLMCLGVVGTIPFDATNDDYLIQIYKYFYPNDSRIPDASKPLFPELNKITDGDNNISSKLNPPDGENWDVNNKNKSDFISTNIYSTIGYRLPTEWLLPTNNALVTSIDGFSKLNFNPNYQYPLFGSDKISDSGNNNNIGSFSYTRNRANNDPINTSELNTNGSKKTTNAGDFVMTWSNNNLAASDLAIFYYEVKVLSVSSSEGGKNSNIVVGFKYSKGMGALSCGYESGGKYTEIVNAQASNDTIRSRNRERRRRNRLNQRRRGSRSSAGNTEPEHTQDDDDIDPNDIMTDSDEDDNNNDEDDEMNDDDDEGNGDIDITTSAHHNVASPRTRGTADPNPTLSSSRAANGIDDTFFGYNGFDGNAFSLTESELFANPFGLNDVIGCGVNYINGTIFFTKNGILLGTAFSEFHDIDLVPAVALKQGNSIQTNFGLFEDFTFDILGYQNKWKARAYSYIYNSSSVNHGYSVKTLSKENDNEMLDTDTKDADSSDLDEGLPYLLGKDKRYDEDNKMNKLEPSHVPINKLSTEDESILSALNCLINGYLIHEGLTDVAKGFLKDLQNEIEPDVVSKTKGKPNKIDYESTNTNTITQRKILRYNERQIIKEEKMLSVRQEIRKLINAKQISKCIEFLRKEIPSFLETNVETLFELKLAQFYINIENDTSNITKLISEGQDLTEEFVYDRGDEFQISEKLRTEFQERISLASALLAYNSPLTEAPPELLSVLSPEYFQDILFEKINSNVLLFLNQTTECALENIVGYTRTMFSTMREYRLEGDQNYEVDPELGLQVPLKPQKVPSEGDNDNEDDNDDETRLETRYYKIVNMDEDILNLC